MADARPALPGFFSNAPAHRRASIVCTIGPASDSEAKLLELARAGMDVARLNFSHGDYAQKEAILTRLAAVEKRIGRPIAMLQDLQGPKLRIGELAGGKPVTLRDGARVVITTTPCFGTAERLSVTYRNLIDDIKPGDPILIADGTITLQVRAVLDGDEIACTVVHGGEVAPRKGVNLPGVSLSLSALTAKDLADAKFGVAHNVDWIALSFVRHAADILRLKKEIAKHRARGLGSSTGLPPRVIAKIEKPEAVSELAAILDAADGIMVARGDLGVELRPESVPLVQKQIIRMANDAGKPVITATQMLESMMHSPVATRAETSDVANAIFDGTDAIMLSGESAAGEFPVEAVRTMAAIVCQAEASPLFAPRMRVNDTTTTAAITAASRLVAADLRAACIAVFTHTGTTAMHLAHQRPMMPIVALCTNRAAARPLMLYWNVQPVHVPVCTTRQQHMRVAEQVVGRLRLAKQGEPYVVVSGSSAASGGTNWVEARRYGVQPHEDK
jgi:pyruvate kinase